MIVLDPQAHETTINAGFRLNCETRGATIPAAVIAATAPCPVKIRIITVINQAIIKGDIGTVLKRLTILSATPESIITCFKIPPEQIIITISDMSLIPEDTALLTSSIFIPLLKPKRITANIKATNIDIVAVPKKSIIAFNTLFVPSIQGRQHHVPIIIIIGNKGIRIDTKNEGNLSFGSSLLGAKNEFSGISFSPGTNLGNIYPAHITAGITVIKP